jgi:hypothetical protein
MAPKEGGGENFTSPSFAASLLQLEPKIVLNNSLKFYLFD